MDSADKVEDVLACYPVDCHSARIEPLGSAGGFSGSRLWRLAAPRGTLLLRRWPEQSDPRRLAFIQSVLGHVAQLGITFVPLAIRTEWDAGYVQQSGRLWELTPWLPGIADYLPERRPEKLTDALTALAQFHRAAASYPSMTSVPASSTGIVQRIARVELLRGSRLQKIVTAAEITQADRETAHTWAELAALAPQIATLFERVSPAVAQELGTAARLAVPLQPCLRDVWHEHVLFDGDRVTGLIDFGAMRIESVAADVARLLGSMAGEDRAAWQTGLTAYQAVRPLSADELALVGVFDRSTTLLAAIYWLEWVFVEGRRFDNPAAATARVREILVRMRALADSGQP